MIGDFGMATSPTSPPTYHNHNKDYNSYTSSENVGPRGGTTTKLTEANEEDTKGYQSISPDGRVRSTYEERTKLKHMKENVTTATLIGEEDGVVGGRPVGKPSVPVMATETRKMAYTETKVSSLCWLQFVT